MLDIQVGTITLNNMHTISFCIPSKNNLRYLKVAVDYLRTNCDNPNHEILVWVDADDDNTSAYLKQLNDSNLRYWVNERSEPFGIGNAYNFLVEQASNELVMMYHTDMIAGKGMDTEVLSYIDAGVVVSATRIEPPLHPTDPAKVTKDFGLWPEENVVDGFKREEFLAYVEHLKTFYQDKTTPGIFAPWLIHKNDYLALGGHDERLNSLAEDIDIFNRMALENYTFVQSWRAYVYHLTCRGGQFEYATTTSELQTRSNDWNNLSYIKTREFIRKWGFQPMAGELREPIVWPQIERRAKLTGCDDSRNVYEIIRAIEPYFTELSIDNHTLQQKYITQEQINTSFDLTKKFSSGTSDYPVIYFDVRLLTSTHFTEFIAKLPLVLSTIDEVGTYEYDIFTIHINKLNEVITC
jgi:glycosyltransferase involved in cell wall biosynthesis